jgi:DNA-binding HxlR family transcriptional regulator
VPALAALAGASGGAKFVTLAHATGASPGGLRIALDELIAHGWARSNPGYGHPLRPEYVLTPHGARVAEHCAALEETLRRLQVSEEARRKWSMPVVFVTGLAPARFTTIADRLAGVTDRALSLTLQRLGEVDLLTRELVDEHPPGAVYSVTRRGRLLVPALGALAAINGRG